MANLIENELSHAYQMARQLEAQLSSAPIESPLILQELIACLEKTIPMVKLVVGETDSPRSYMEDSDQPFKAEKKIPKKRKSHPKWANQVKLGTGPEAQGPLDDGYSWRKYGKKDILGAKNPRGYYRCTHRDNQGCQARKHVQESDNDPFIFEVTYHGTHTCLQKTSFPNYGHKNNQQPLRSFQTNLKVETENLDLKFQDPTSSFSFPPTPIDNCFESGSNAAFISPTNSESNYFSASPCGMSSYGGPIIHASELDFGQIMSSISPKPDDDFWMELDADLQSDPSNFFI